MALLYFHSCKHLQELTNFIKCNISSLSFRHFAEDVMHQIVYFCDVNPYRAGTSCYSLTSKGKASHGKKQLNLIYCLPLFQIIQLNQAPFSVQKGYISLKCELFSSWHMIFFSSISSLLIMVIQAQFKKIFCCFRTT